MADGIPVLMIVEIEPTETDFMEVGGSYRSHLQILNVDTRDPVDPDATYPQLIVTPPYGTPVTYVLGGVGSIIVRNSQGNFQADIPIARAGKNRSQWFASVNAVPVGSNTSQLQGVLSRYW